MARIGYTDEQILDLIQSIKNPVHFIENNIKLHHPTEGLIPFKLHPFQKNLVEAFQTGKHTIAVMPRQMGKTQTSLAYLIWYACAHENKTILIGAVNYLNGCMMMEKIREMISTTPEGLVPKMRENNRHSICFENGTRIHMQILSENFSRGMSVNLYYIDELAFAGKRAREWFLDLVAPCLFHSQLIVTSTPNPNDDLLPKLYEAALTCPGTWNAIRISWDDLPGRDQDFKNRMISFLGEELWKTEYECQFINKE